MLGVVADAGASGPKRRAVKRDAHGALSASSRGRDRQSKGDRHQDVGGGEAQKRVDEAVQRRWRAPAAATPRPERRVAAARTSRANAAERAPARARGTPARRAHPLPASTSRYMLLLWTRAIGVRDAGVVAVGKPEVVGADAGERMRRQTCAARRATAPARPGRDSSAAARPACAGSVRAARRRAADRSRRRDEHRAPARC